MERCDKCKKPPTTWNQLNWCDNCQKDLCTDCMISDGHIKNCRPDLKYD